MGLWRAQTFILTQLWQARVENVPLGRHHVAHPEVSWHGEKEGDLLGKTR